MEEKDVLEQVPTIRAGDRVLRRQRKRRGLFNIIFRRFLRIFKSKTGR